MLKRYRIDYDYAIADALYRYGPLWYRELKRKIESEEYLNKTISFETFHYHLKKLLKSAIVVKSNNHKRGQQHLLRLSSLAAEQKRLGTFKVGDSLDIKPKLQPHNTFFEELSADERMQAIYVIVGMATNDVYLYRDVNREVIGTIKRSILHNSCSLPITNWGQHISIGVSVKDFVDGSHGLLEFWSVNFSELAIENALKALMKEDVVTEICVEGAVPKYVIHDEELKEFFDECLTIRDAAIMPRFLTQWNNIKLLNTQEERIYYELWNGGEYANEEIQNMKINLDTQKQRPDYKQVRKDAENRLEMLDYNIYYFYNKIKKKYYGLFRKLPALATGILDVIFPHFLVRRGERIHKNSLQNGKKYLRLLISSHREYLFC